MQNTHPLLNSKEAAKYLSLSPSTLAKQRMTGNGPTFVKMVRRVAYKVTDLDAWLNAQRKQSTSEYGDR